MAQLNFTIANGLLTIGSTGRTTNYTATDFRAKSEGDYVVIYPMTGSVSEAYLDKPFKGLYTDIAIDVNGAGVSPASAEAAVTIFNAGVGASIGYNTQYPQHIISDTVDVGSGVVTQLTTIAKAGYLTITAETDNQSDVYIGGSNITTGSYALEAGKSIYMELSNLSSLYALAGNTHDVVYIIGAYKY